MAGAISASHQPHDQYTCPYRGRSTHPQRLFGHLRRRRQQLDAQLGRGSPQQTLDHQNQPESNEQITHFLVWPAAELPPFGLLKYLKKSLSGESSMRVSVLIPAS